MHQGHHQAAGAAAQICRRGGCPLWLAATLLTGAPGAYAVPGARRTAGVEGTYRWHPGH